MSKIIRAANAMASNPQKIGSVVPGPEPTELFFMYGEYKWSIRTDANKTDYWLYFYPTEDINRYMGYNDLLLGRGEATQTFAELYRIVQEKHLGVDQALDDIIGDL